MGRTAISIYELAGRCAYASGEIVCERARRIAGGPLPCRRYSRQPPHCVG
jgi:hypothetical protein